LPLGTTGYGNSPYQPLSSFAGNGLVISPEWLIEDELLAASDCEHPSFSVGAVDYDAIIPFKHRIFEKAWNRFRTGTRADLRPDYERFCHDQDCWLQDYALFRALKAKFGNGALNSGFWECPLLRMNLNPASAVASRCECRRRAGNAGAGASQDCDRRTAAVQVA
jgi:4-alpha-glucanotransferase